MNKNALTILLTLSTLALPPLSTLAYAGPGGVALPGLKNLPGGRGSTSSDGAAAVTATKPADPFEAMCAVSTEAIGPQLAGDEDKGNLGWFKHLWRQVLVDADRTQFVTSNVDKTVYHEISVSKSLKGTIKAGEPLLVTGCTEYGGDYVRVITADGVFKASFKPAELVPDPEAFVFPEHAVQPFNVWRAYGDASPAERSVAPEMAALEEKKGDCMTEALGACMAAEKKVAAGPWRADLEEAKAAACDEARDASIAACMSSGTMNAYRAGAQKIYEATLAGDADFWSAMEAKLQ